MEVTAGELLRTKLQGPRCGRDLVTRPRLVERLNQGLCVRLTLVCAPAGYGKSTLLAEWAKASGYPTAWLSLDQRDNDLLSFLRYFVAALRTQFSEACPVTLRALQAPTLPVPEYLAEVLAGELAHVHQPCILVLDDFHLVRAPEVLASIARLLEILPDTIHLALACRFDPFLPLARYRASGELHEVRGEDLRFTLVETTEFLKRNLSPDLTPEVIGALHTRTEGWIAMLQLTAQSLRDQRDLVGPVSRTVAHTDRQAAGYLLEEFLAQQAEPVQDFLLRTSILDSFCAPLCATVAIDGDTRVAHEHLSQLSLSNPLLLALDDRQVWYRYHQLLRDSLRMMLAQRLAPEEIAGLHRRASDWYAGSGLIDDAIAHALAAGDLQAAAQLVEGTVRLAIEQAQVIDLDRRLRLLPPEMLRSNPALLIGQAFIAQARDELQRLPALLRGAEAGMQRADWQAGDELRLFVSGVVHIDWSLFCHFTGQSQHSLQHAELALELAPSTDQWVRAAALYQRGRAHQALGRNAEAMASLREELASSAPDNLVYVQQILLGLAQGNRWSGEMPQLEEAGRQMLDVTLQARMEVRSGWAHMLLAMACYEMNHLEAAVPLFAAVVAEPSVTHNLVLRDCVAGLALAYQAQGLSEQANEVASKHVEFLRRTQRFSELTHAHALQALLALRQGDLRAAEQAVEVAGIGPDPGVMEWLVVPRLVHARVLLAQGDKENLRQALAICDDVADRAAATHNLPKQVETHALRALVYEAQGRTPGALGALSQGLTLGLPGGLVRTFLDLDAPVPQSITIGRLLRELCEQSSPNGSRPLAAYAGRLLAAYQAMPRPRVDVEATTETVARAQPLPWVNNIGVDAYAESLTEREMEVLRLLAQHYSNKEIAAQLVIAVGTVKSHTTRIYGKLEADNRREAVVRARQLGILAER